MRTLAPLMVVFLLLCATAGASTKARVQFGVLASEGYCAVHDAQPAPDGSVVVCGVVSGKPALPGDAAVHRLTRFEVGAETGFVASVSADFSKVHWVAHFGSAVFCPTRVVVGKDGVIAVGGIQMKNLPAAAGGGDDWKKADTAVASLSPDGSKLNWIVRGGPNQQGGIRRDKTTQAMIGYGGGVTGLAVDAKGRVYFTAGTRGRQQAAYLIRLDPATGKSMGFADSGRGWCIDLHTNDKQLNAPGQFYHYYKNDGRDYDGEGRGWGPVDYDIKGIRQGGQVVVLPDGDLIVTGTLQYDFRVKGKKKYPAFDLLVARYSSEGKLRWSTNLYQANDSVHTPDQKAVDLHYDAATGDVLVLAKQHGSNVYRFKGELRGDTGNMMISWLGRVDAKTGAIKDGWYFANRRPGSSPKWPKLAGNDLRSVTTDAKGRVYLTGSGGAAVETTKDALADWPAGQTGGGHGVLIVLDPSFKTLHASVLRADQGQVKPYAMALAGKHVYIVGSTRQPLVGWQRLGWSSSNRLGGLILRTSAPAR